MEDIKKYKLEDLGFLGRGKSRHRPRNDPSLFDGKYPFIQTGEVKSAEFYLNTFEETYNQKGLEQSKLWDPGTLLITIAANIAETAILDIKACFPDSILGFIPDEEKADVRFIKYYIDTIKLKMQSISRGTTQDNLSLQKLRSIDFKIPSVYKQRRIADILTAFDNLIENNTRRIAILEEMAWRVYREWFLHFNYPGNEDDELVDSGTELGEIPKDWEVKRLKYFLKFKNGKSPETKEGDKYPVYGSNGIIGKCNEPGWEDGIIIGRVGAYCGSVKYCEGKFWGSDNTIVATSNGDYDFPLFSYFKLKDLNLRRYAGGSAQPLMTQTVIQDIKTVIACDTLLEKFNSQARNLWWFKRNLEKKNKKLKETRDLLLTKLISGKIDVEEVKID